jgi:N-methylhydantoinase A
VCYGAGGLEPTVTDAHLVLGRIPSHLLGGEIALDVDRARRAIEEHVARPLGLSPAAAAQGILDIVNNNMVGALRLVSVERGYDPRDFVLVPFGGAGPLHGADLAALLGMRTVVVPRHPGVLSTFGLLGTEVRNDYARTSLQKPPDYDLGAVASVYADLEGQARAWLAAEGVGPSARRITRLADLRYRHQGFELTVPWPERDLAVDALVARFHARHRQLYTYALTDAPVEIVTLRVAAAGRVRRFTLPSLARRGAAARRHPRRRVHFAGIGWRDCPCLDREGLGVSAVVIGPAIVEQPDTTTVVPPGYRARVDRVGNLVIQTVRSPSPPGERAG